MKFLLKSAKVTGVLFLVMIGLILAACGDTGSQETVAVVTATSVAEKTANTKVESNVTPMVSGNATTVKATTGNPGTTITPNSAGVAVKGTIQSYDTASKILTIKTKENTIQQFELNLVRFGKTELLSQAELVKYASGTGVIYITGEMISGGSYRANRLIVDLTAQSGNGTGTGKSQGTVSVTKGTPGSGTGASGNIRAYAGVIVRNALINGNTISGTDVNGQAITVELAENTILAKLIIAGASDLQEGQVVNLFSRITPGGEMSLDVVLDQSLLF